MDKDLRRIEAAGERLAKIIRGRHSSERRAGHAGVGLSGAAQGVLRCVIERGPLRVSEISRVTRSVDPAVSRLVTQLCEEGYLERVSDPDDGRAALVRPTRRGRAVAARLRRAADEIFEDCLGDWKAEDASTLADLLERFCSDLAREH